MAIGGKKRVQADYSKKVGWDEMNIVAINPTLEELEDMLNIPNMKEPVYLGDYQDPDDGKSYKTTTISIWLQGKESKALFNARYRITDQVRYNKDKTKMQFINDVGNTAWAKDEATLRGFATDSNPKESSRKFYKEFISREFREALSGEEKLYGFLQTWTNLETRDLSTELKLDTKALFKGNFRGVRDLMDSEYKDNTLCGCATIRVKREQPSDEKPSGGFIEYQSVYEEFLQGSYIRYFNSGKLPLSIYNPKFDVSKPENKENRPGFINKMEGEYGCKDYFIKEKIRDYNSDENPAIRDIKRSMGENLPEPVEQGMGQVPDNVDDLPF